MNREPIFNKHGQHCGYKGEMYSYLDEGRNHERLNDIQDVA